MATQATKFTPKVLKMVTLPVLKMVADGKPRYFWFKGPMHLGKKIDDQKEAATIMEAVDCETGQVGQIVVPTVMRKELHEQYPKDAYVNKFFEVVLTRVKDKSYNIVGLTEIADPREDLRSIAEKQAAGSIAKD
jgi:hypothetical protein